MANIKYKFILCAKKLCKRFCLALGVLIVFLGLMSVAKSVSAENIGGLAFPVGFALSEEEAGRLKKYSTKRPRVLVDEERIESFLAKTKDDEYEFLKINLLNKAKYFVKAGNSYGSVNKKAEPLGRIGKRLPFLAMSYLLTKDEIYLKSAIKSMDYLSSMKGFSGGDLDRAHALSGMAISYDWLYGDISNKTRIRYRAYMTKHAGIILRSFVNRNTWWSTDYMQNHNYVNAMALGIAGLALAGEDSASSLYLAAAQSNFVKVLSLLSPDGASHEGVHYWSYGTQAIAIYVKAAEAIFGLNHIKNNRFFQNTARFRLYMSLPGYEDIATYADSSRKEFFHSGAVLRFLAGLFNDGHSQWLAKRIDQNKGNDFRYSWLDILWNDPSIAPVKPENLPNYAYFENLGILVRRSDWADDASWMLFKAGAPQGKHAASKGVYTGSHIHPDAGGYMLWSGGKWLVPDDGYVWLKKTANHSVLLFNDIGQVGEGDRWFDTKMIKKYKSSANIVRINLDSDAQVIEADLTSMYPPESKLKKWIRTVVVLPNGYILVRDRVKAAVASKIESLVHFVNGETFNTKLGLVTFLNGAGLAVDSLSKSSPKKEIKHHSIKERVNRVESADFPRSVVKFFSDKVSEWDMTYLLRPLRNGKKPGKLEVKWNDTSTGLDVSDDLLKININFSNLNVLVAIQ